MDRPAVDEQALPEAAQLDADDLRREPAVGDRWQGCTQSAQLAVLARQGLVPHRAQLEVALRRAQARILGLQPLAALEALPDPAPGCGRGVHRELDGVSGGLQQVAQLDRKSTRLNSSHSQISYAVFCL